MRKSIEVSEPIHPLTILADEDTSPDELYEMARATEDPTLLQEIAIHPNCTAPVAYKVHERIIHDLRGLRTAAEYLSRLDATPADIKARAQYEVEHLDSLIQDVAEPFRLRGKLIPTELAGSPPPGDKALVDCAYASAAH